MVDLFIYLFLHSYIYLCGVDILEQIGHEPRQCKHSNQVEASSQTKPDANLLLFIVTDIITSFKIKYSARSEFSKLQESRFIAFIPLSGNRLVLICSFHVILLSE